MVVPDLNFTPPEAANEEPEEEGNNGGQNAGVQSQRNWLADAQRYVAYMSLETLHKSIGGRFKGSDKKEVAAIFGAHV
ncbi:hypothetical protein D1007_23372 [Hordeum vulgare]|nr:hypothetical protein D1007_23372 [Hordeum vulgare]